MSFSDTFKGKQYKQEIKELKEKLYVFEKEITNLKKQLSASELEIRALNNKIYEYELKIEKSNKIIDKYKDEEQKRLIVETYQKLHEQVKKENKIYDPEFEKEIEVQLSKLDSRAAENFYYIRANRETYDNEILSNKQLDLLTLKSMQESHKAHTIHEKNIKKVGLDNIENISKEDIKLSVYELILLNYINSKKCTIEYLPLFFTFEFNLDLNKCIHRFFAGDYLSISPINDFVLGCSTLKELRSVLKKYSLPVSGKKEVLIKRLFDNLSTDDLEKEFTDKYFILTQKGKNLCNINRPIVDAWKNRRQKPIDITKFKVCYNNDDFKSTNSFYYTKDNEVTKEFDSDELKNRFYNANKYKTYSEFNFICSHVDTIVAFISLGHYQSIIAILDDNFNILSNITTDAYIHGCNISHDGTVITFITARSSGVCSDSIFIVNMITGEILTQIQTPKPCKEFKSCHVFDDGVEYFFNDLKIKYDFNGKVLYEKTY